MNVIFVTIHMVTDEGLNIHSLIRCYQHVDSFQGFDSSFYIR